MLEKQSMGSKTETKTEETKIVEPEPKEILIEASDNAHELLNHHKKDGAVDGSKIQSIMARIKSGKIRFVGQYHETRHDDFIKHLELHS